MKLRLLALFLVLGCNPEVQPNQITPPPTPVPLALAVNPPSRKATTQPGAATPSDNAAIVLSGDNASATSWTATNRHSWITVTNGAGTGTGAVTWARNTIGLTTGIYVDTITIVASGASGSPTFIIDTLQITTAPVPLTLVVNPATRSTSSVQGNAAADENVAITLTGDNAASTTWTAASRKAWTALVTAGTTGSGLLGWHRNTAGLPVGTYVDTVTIVAPGAAGSPFNVIDTIHVLPPPVPLTIALSPSSRSTSAVQGTSAANGSATVTITGDNASTAAWSASKKKAWTTLTTSAGTGNGTVAWGRAVTGLAVGTYVDTITVTSPGAIGSPQTLIDTLVITAAPSPLTLTVTAMAGGVTITQGAAAPNASAVVDLSGTNGTTTAWTATKRKSWTTLTNAAGTGSGTVAWTRSTMTLTAGIYIDTITVFANGAAGSPSFVIDTIRINAPGGGGGGGGGGGVADLGVLADLHGKQVLPPSDPWNQPVDTAQVDPNSLAILSQIGLTKALHPDFGCCYGGPFGFPYTIVPDNTPRFPFIFDYAGESDPGPYPIPVNPAIEGGGDLNGDAHLLIITQNEWKLYETFWTHLDSGQWYGGSGAIFDLVHGTQRPAGWTSSDAAGLPIFPGLVRYDEVYLRGVINHAIRMTVTYSRKAYIPPATHWASYSTDPLRPPMGMRVRLKASVNISGYPEPMQVILRALKKYGLMVADNGGDFFISGTADARWDDDMTNLLKQVKVGDFEVIKMTGVVTP